MPAQLVGIAVRKTWDVRNASQHAKEEKPGKQQTHDSSLQRAYGIHGAHDTIPQTERTKAFISVTVQYPKRNRRR